MAMDNDKLMKYALLAGGAYAVYWYVTNHGPNGAVYGVGGVSTGNVSYWDTWFGTAQPVGTVSGQTGQTQTVTPGTPPAGSTVVIPPASVADQNYQAVKAKILSAATGNALLVNGQMNADMWNFYFQQFAPAIPDFNAIFVAHGEDRNNMPYMTLDQFLTAIRVAGLPVALKAGVSGVGAIVPTQAQQSLPLSIPDGPGPRDNPNSQQDRGLSSVFGRGQKGGYIQ